ncbi:MAG TPA: hypothetical protein VN426_05575 [Syntrophomonadaceae bacterium]|nr:hypothetical protein [Syntrophomonadaceae bacterium]
MEFLRKYKKTIIIYSICTLVFLAFIFWSDLFPSSKEVYNTSEMKVMEGSVLSKSQDSDGYYLQVAAPGLPNSPLDVQANPDFYQNAAVGQKLGILVGNVEKYLVSPSWDKLQLKINYDSSAWEILSLYPTLADAQKENKPASFTTNASLTQRIKSADGHYFFLFDAGGKKLMGEVNKDYYDRYNPQSTPKDLFVLQFEGSGDFNHLVAIVEPK